MYTGARDEFLRRSPITFAPDVRTPVLLLHGEEDLRCPIEQSEQYFVALKRLGKTVEFVRLPDSNHSFWRSGNPGMVLVYYRPGSSSTGSSGTSAPGRSDPGVSHLFDARRPCQSGLFEETAGVQHMPEGA